MLVLQGADQADPQSVSVTMYCYFARLGNRLHCGNRPSIILQRDLSSAREVNAIDKAFNNHSRWVLYPHMAAFHFDYWAASFDHPKVCSLHAQPSCGISTTARRLPAYSIRRVYPAPHGYNAS
ncbi:hypothetical protein IG631_22231 [Alternaria alternata]|nr:hypothetical protein IG631_22231 [Alternaria alternata]